jgi:hypothetical protein
MITVCIQLDDQGQYSVGVEPQNEQASEPGEGTGQDTSQAGGSEPEYQPAKSLQEALMMAGRLLSQGEKQNGPSPFDQGLNQTMQQKGMGAGMMQGGM